MTLSPHEILAKLADSERSKAEEALMAMSVKRQELQARREEVMLYISQLEAQREKVLKGGTQASMLMMMESALGEQHDRIEHIRLALDSIHQQEQTLIQGWIKANQKNQIHEKMHHGQQKKGLGIRERKVQQQLDDMSASRLNLGAGI